MTCNKEKEEKKEEKEEKKENEEEKEEKEKKKGDISKRNEEGEGGRQQLPFMLCGIEVCIVLAQPHLYLLQDVPIRHQVTCKVEGEERVVGGRGRGGVGGGRGEESKREGRGALCAHHVVEEVEVVETAVHLEGFGEARCCCVS